MLDLDLPVVCVNCKKKYMCTPANDYYGPEGVPQDNISGRCWNCMLNSHGFENSPEPANPNVLQPITRVKNYVS